MLLTFIISGLYTLIVFSVGAFIGTMISSKKLEEKVREIKAKVTPPPPSSGGVKAITPDEIVKERHKGLGKTIADLQE